MVPVRMLTHSVGKFGPVAKGEVVWTDDAHAAEYVAVGVGEMVDADEAGEEPAEAGPVRSVEEAATVEAAIEPPPVRPAPRARRAAPVAPVEQVPAADPVPPSPDLLA